MPGTRSARLIQGAALTAAAAAILLSASAPEQPRVAITVDDLPWTGGAQSDAATLAATTRMVDALQKHRAPVAVFVNCGRLQDHDPRLARWIAAGATIGNHTANHRELNGAPLGAWLHDVRTCDAALRNITGVPVRYFRYPMLHEGITTQQRAAARSLVRKLGYTNAVVTIDNSDYLLYHPYSALHARGDSARARAVIAAALAHDLAATSHFQEVARTKVGREVPHILLLHSSLLTAVMMPALLDSLQHRGFRFISLEDALKDPVFAKPTCYTGAIGVSFLYRIAPCTAGEDAWDVREQESLVKRFPETPSP